MKRKTSARDKVLAAARQLFATNGYEQTSTEKVLEASGVSRGALYHHFKNKEALFEAVLETVEQELAAIAIGAAAATQDSVDGLRAALTAFLDRASEPEISRIVLQDAHTVVGWQKWRAIESRHGLGLIKAGLMRIAPADQQETSTIDLNAHILLAALIEVAHLISIEKESALAKSQGIEAINRLVDRLLC